MVLKVNEFLYNPSGVTMKTSRDQLKPWMEKINRYYESLMYTTTVQDLDKDGKKYIYTLQDHKFVFEYYMTGRIIVKTNDVQLLQKEFIANHEMILGVKLEMAGSLNRSHSLSVIPSPKRNARSASGRLQSNQQSNSTTSSSLKDQDPVADADVWIKQSPAPPPVVLKCDHAAAFQIHGKELLNLRNKVKDMKSEIARLQEEMEEVQRQQCMDGKHAEEMIKKMHDMALYINGSDNIGRKTNEADMGPSNEADIQNVEESNGESQDSYSMGGVADIGSIGGYHYEAAVDNGAGERINGGVGGGVSGYDGVVGEGVSLKEFHGETKGPQKKRNVVRRTSVICMAEHYENQLKEF